MVGAQLEGFDTMVHLTEENDFYRFEGDEYLSSPIDRRPKFHLYQPNIALIRELLGIISMFFLHMRIMWNSLRFCRKITVVVF
jgi:hypothetical protein